METSIQRVSAAEMERMMKVQEVILKAMAGSLKWWEAAEILGVTDRAMRRWRQSCQERGYDGLYDYREGRQSPQRIPVEKVEQVPEKYLARGHAWKDAKNCQPCRQGEKQQLHVGAPWDAGKAKCAIARCKYYPSV